MDQERQQAFQKLRPVCVELSSIVLKFKAKQATVKDVLRVLLEQHRVLDNLGQRDRLDEKLAEYAFFPLTHVLKESQNLSPRCMEVAIQSITTLVSYGWRANLAPAMGQQLLIFMSLLSGGDPRKQIQPPGEELKHAAFVCAKALIVWLGKSSAGKSFFQDQTARNIVDQLAYLLIENITEASSDNVQIAAAEAMLELCIHISNRVFLASLLPRTVSCLTKALKPSTEARRTRKVLVTDLELLGTILKMVLADDVALRDDKSLAETEALTDSWLKATAAQVKNALIQVCKLRTHEQVDVRTALFDLCVTIVENCSTTVIDSVPVLVETAVILMGDLHNQIVVSGFKNLIMTRTDLVDILQSSFYDWSQSLSRIMQGNDDKPKDLMLTRLTQSFGVLSDVSPNIDKLTSTLSSALLTSIAASTETDANKSIQTYANESGRQMSLIQGSVNQNSMFDPVLFNHESQKSSSQGMLTLIQSLQQHASAGKLTRNILDSLQTFAPDQRMAPVWLVIQLLRPNSDSAFEFDDMLDLTETTSDLNTSRAYLIQDLYVQTKDIILELSPFSPTPPPDNRLVALALEALVLQAKQLGQAYRTELYETLYPVIALLSSRSNLIQGHAITTLNLVATSCGYSSVADMLIENVDYLVNSIAWKLNSFNLSPEAPAVLDMVVTLVGANVVPYLDDLIDSIFSALDNFHGYTEWVEMLFKVLKTIVDESTKQPQLSITDGREGPAHEKVAYQIMTVDGIVNSLRARKRRKIVSETIETSSERESAPQRPWTRAQDDPNYKPDPTEGKDFETLMREAEIADDENDLPAPKEPEKEDPTKPLSKSHSLLLKIAQATVPHLSSPSPRVRHILLQLLSQISPLLARHENTFLPLVNAVWPGVTQRVFANIANPASSGDEAAPEGELAYNVVAAADVMAVICENAGDFMASRIEQIFVQLKSVYSKLWKEVEASLARNKKRETTSAGSSSTTDTAGKNISGIVDLQVIKSESQVTVSVGGTTTDPSLALSSVSRTSTGQVFNAVARLLVTILNHVRLSADNADEIFHMLSPLVDYPSTGTMVADALENHNPDALWVLRCKNAIKDEIARGVRNANDRVWRDVQMPTLSDVSIERGIVLQPVVF